MAEATVTDKGSTDAKPAPAPSGVSVKLMILVAGAALLLGLGGATLFFKLTGGRPAPNAHAESASNGHGGGAGPDRAGGDGRGHDKDAKGAPAVFFDMDPFIVNLADAPDVRYLKLAMKVELEHAAVAADLTARLPQVRDAVLMLLSSKESAALRTAQGKSQLREELIQRLNVVAPHGGVRTVYFTEFVVQ